MTATSNVQYKRADVDGFKVFYREAGPKGAPKLLLLHGFPQHWWEWRQQIPAFAQRSRWDCQELSSSPQLCGSPGQDAAGFRLASSVTQGPPSTAEALSQAFGR